MDRIETFSGTIFEKDISPEATVAMLGQSLVEQLEVLGKTSNPDVHRLCHFGIVMVKQLLDVLKVDAVAIPPLSEQQARVERCWMAMTDAYDTLREKLEEAQRGASSLPDNIHDLRALAFDCAAKALGPELQELRELAKLVTDESNATKPTPQSSQGMLPQPVRVSARDLLAALRVDGEYVGR